MDVLVSDTLLDCFEEPCLLFDETWTVRECNDAALGFWDTQQLSTRKIGDLLPESDADVIRDAGRGLAAGETATVRARFENGDGDAPQLECCIHRQSTSDDATGYVLVGRETTDRTVTEHQRREILDRMTGGFFAVDDSWTLTYVNEYARHVLREAMDLDDDVDPAGRHLWEEIPDAVDTQFYEHYTEAMRTQEPISFESFFEPLDTWFEVRTYPSETGLSIYFTDITERKRHRESLENREQVLRQMHEVIADRDQPFDAKVEALLDLGRSELDTAYGTLSEIRGDEYVFEIVSAADDSIEAGDVVPLSATNCELAARDQQTLVLGDVARDAPAETDRSGYADWGIECYIGAPVLVDDEVYGTFCFYDTEPREGQFSEWDVALVDIMSRWVSYELQRQLATERLQKQNEKLEQFASIVSHDLRNPLNVVMGSIESFEGVEDTATMARCRRALDRMDALIDDLLSLARAGRMIDEVEPVDLDSLVEDCLGSLSVSDGTLDTGLTIEADPARLRQMVENLLENAVDHGGDTVSVTVGALDDGFYVADDGPGIPIDDRDSVFESGFTTSDEGTGFGLAIVAEVSDAHGWRIDVTDSDSGGARFEFRDVSVLDSDG